MREDPRQVTTSCPRCGSPIVWSVQAFEGGEQFEVRTWSCSCALSGQERRGQRCSGMVPSRRPNKALLTRPGIVFAGARPMPGPEAVSVDCPRCGVPMRWQRHRPGGEPTLALAHWPCRCPLTVTEWADVTASAAFLTAQGQAPDWSPLGTAQPPGPQPPEAGLRPASCRPCSGDPHFAL
jgi:endogenous inhibitor of DNA gyrase (YacG/DUF329 family)